MRIRLYGAQLTPGLDVTAYARTEQSQVLPTKGTQVLLWGDTPELEASDPGWTQRGALLSGGDKFTLWKPKPAKTPFSEWEQTAPPLPHYASLVFQLPYQPSDTPLNILDIGPAGIMLIGDKLGWRDGEDIIDLEIRPPNDQPLYFLYELTTDTVRIWFNNGIPIELPYSGEVPTQFVLGGGAQMGAALLSLHAGYLQGGGALAMYKYVRLVADGLNLRLPDAEANLNNVRITGYFNGSVDAVLTGDIREWKKTWTIDGKNYAISFIEVE